MRNGLHHLLATLLGVALAAGLLAACSDDGDEDAAPRTSVADGDGTDTGGDTVTGPPIGELDGEGLYLQICAACHQPGGTGIEGVFPPLADNAFVALAEPAPVASTVVHGRAGMPAFGPALSDTEIAAILSYLRTELNDAEEVPPEVVASAREPEAVDEAPRDEDEDDVGEEEDQGE